MAENKTKPTSLSVAAFVDSLEDETRRADAKALLQRVHQAERNLFCTKSNQQARS